VLRPAWGAVRRSWLRGPVETYRNYPYGLPSERCSQ